MRDAKPMEKTVPGGSPSPSRRHPVKRRARRTPSTSAPREKPTQAKQQASQAATA